jgi:hypothetical protein
MSDDFVVDFSDTEAMGGGFDPIPAAWYAVAIADYDTTETRNEGKIPQGTPGINWMFEVDGGEYDTRKLWTNHWLHPKTLGFLKGLLLATGRFTEEELNQPLTLDAVYEMCDRAVGAKVAARVKLRKANDQYDARNEIGAIKALEELPSGGGSAAPTSLLP